MFSSDWIPDPLLAPGPWGVAWWQWIGLLIVVVLSLVVAGLVTSIAIGIVRRMTSRTASRLDDVMLDRLAGPFRLLGTTGCARGIVPFLALSNGAAEVVADVLLVGFAVGVVWAALRAIDVLTFHFTQAAWVVQRPASRAILSLIGRTSKAIVVAIATIAALGKIGLPVTSLLAGLGIGGIALAFGAQKTIENLFGAFAIGVDQPLREGEFVRLDADVLGTVERVGLRSTRIRTLDRTVVSLPNGRLADMRIETFAERDRCRLTTTIGVVYDTTAAQLREVLDGFERVLREHPKIWPDDVIVRFAGFGASSLDIEIMAWFVTGDWSEFRAMRQDVLLRFMDVVERAGSSFAFPTQTIHVVGPVSKPLQRDRVGAMEVETIARQ